MLPKNQRIARPQFGLYSSTKIRPYHHPFFTIRIAYTEESAPSSAKIACIVSKKVTKSSVDRHVLRRRTYDCFIPFLTELPSNVLYFITLKPDARTASFQELFLAISDFISSHK